MKKIIIALLLALPLSIFAQKQGVKQAATPKIDTPKLVINLITGEVATFKGDALNVRFELNCKECLSFRYVSIDATTSDTLAKEIKLLTLQGKIFYYEKEKFVVFQKGKEADDADIKELEKEKAALDAEIRRKIDEKKKSKQ